MCLKCVRMVMWSGVYEMFDYFVVFGDVWYCVVVCVYVGWLWVVCDDGVLVVC